MMSLQAAKVSGARRSVESIRRVVDSITRVMALLAVSAIIFIALATVTDVSRRYLTGKSIAGVFELGELMMVIIVFLSIGYTETRRAHISVTLLTDRIPKGAQKVITGLGLLIVIVVIAWMVYATTGRAISATESNEFRHGLVAIPIWPARWVVVVGLAGFLLELTFRFLDVVWPPRPEPSTDGLAAAAPTDSVTHENLL